MSLWPDVISDYAQQVVGDHEIGDLEEDQYQNIADLILATIRQRGPERLE
jgi:hypothetical protein